MTELEVKLTEELTLKEVQLTVHRYVQQFKDGYFPPMSQIVRLTEEVGELAREINHRYGEKQKKATEADKLISEELADVLVVLVMLANSLEIDLSKAFSKDMEKFNRRDAFRFERKDGMKEEGSSIEN